MKRLLLLLLSPLGAALAAFAPGVFRRLFLPPEAK